jgi:hypothetical protein
MDADPSNRDWQDWHDHYDEPGSYLGRRLARVQQRLRDAIEACGPGPIRILSLCAGQGRDVLGVLAGHPRVDDISARLVELDEASVVKARLTAAEHDLRGVEVVAGDAGSTDAAVGAAPADIVLLCGIFGNVTDDDVHRTVAAAPMLCAPGATVLWTRHRGEPDLTPSIRGWFADAGFTEVTFDAPDDVLFSVGANRLAIDPPALTPGVQLFRFIGDGTGTV